MDCQQSKEPPRIVRIFRDSVCLGDDVSAPNSLSFRYLATDPRDFIKEVFNHLPHNDNCIWFLYAANENAGEWQYIGHIISNQEYCRIYSKLESIPATLWEDTYRTVLWCEYYNQNRFPELEGASYFREKELLSQVNMYLLTESHDNLMKKRYERFVKEQPAMRAFCNFEYDDKEARKEMRKAFAVRSFRSYLGIYLEGLLLVSVLPAFYAIKAANWIFLFPFVFCTASLAAWVLFNVLHGLRISNGLFPKETSCHRVKCSVFDDFVLSIEKNGERKRLKTNELVDIIDSGKFVFLLYEKGRYIVLDRQFDKQKGRNMEMSAEYRYWRSSVLRREDKAQRLAGACLTIVFLFLLAILFYKSGCTR